jgi:catechol 2,3-dioxygenase-like lactoylglutathione lyase family enzyme
MFEHTKAFSGFSVDDLDAARRFYGETLGIAVDDAGEGGLLTLNIAGDRPTLIYPKPDHQPAAFTILNFPVDDIEAAVAELGRRGVTFEHYEGMTDEQGIMRQGGPLIAWFRDPAGNVLSVLETS